MAQYTTNLNLLKPSPLDSDIDIHDSLSQNFQNIDDEVGPLTNTLGTISYTYNPDGTVDTITTPHKTYTYNYLNGQVDYVDETDGTETIRSTYTFGANGYLQTVVREVI